MASRTFLDALVPTQARAITRVHFACDNGMCPAFEVMRRLKKLEILTVQVIEYFYNRRNGRGRFDAIFDLLKNNLRGVKEFDLKSFRIAMLVDGVDGTLTRAEEDDLMESLQRTERSLLRLVV